MCISTGNYDTQVYVYIASTKNATDEDLICGLSLHAAFEILHN